MAMIKCPQCKGKIADTALTCPHCGHVLKEEVIKKDKEKIVMLKRLHVSYGVDIALIILPYSLIALELINKYLLIPSIFLCLLFSIWGILSILKKRKNNRIAKELVYYDKEKKELTCFDLNIKEYVFPSNLVFEIKKDNVITQRVFIKYKKIKEDNTYTLSKICLGYAKSEDIKSFQTKLKSIIDISLSIDE